MLKGNLLIHTIRVHFCYSKHEIYRKSVIPCLETNRLRPRLLAIQKTRPITYRAKVLGRALLAVRTDPNSFWMLLSGNPEVAFSSTTTTIAAAADLQTPSTAAAATTSTAHVVAFGTSVIPALTIAATASLSNAATPATASATILLLLLFRFQMLLLLMMIRSVAHVLNPTIQSQCDCDGCLERHYDPGLTAMYFSVRLAVCSTYAFNAEDRGT
jgi:hypothetical protein